MQNDRLEDLIQKLIEEGEKAQSFTSTPADNPRHLPPERQLAWAQLLSSAASAEESEEMVIEPILEAFKFSPLLHRYMFLHAADESRHQFLLKAYVKDTFRYVKKKKTLTDKVIYGGVFKSLKGVTAKRPLAIVVATLFYEWFAEEFYSDLVQAAERDGLLQLKSLFLQVERDEKRHRAGLKAVLALWKLEGKKVDSIDLVFTKTLLNIVRMDVNTAPWAFYNKKLRRNLIILGIDNDSIYARSKIYADRAFNELKVLQGSV